MSPLFWKLLCHVTLGWLLLSGEVLAPGVGAGPPAPGPVIRVPAEEAGGGAVGPPALLRFKGKCAFGRPTKFNWFLWICAGSEPFGIEKSLPPVQGELVSSTRTRNLKMKDALVSSKGTDGSSWSV